MVATEFSTTRPGSLLRSEERTNLAVVVLATGLAAALALLFIGDKCLWLDEGASMYFAHDVPRLWERLVHREANMWLYYLLLSLWLRLGDSETVARGLSALFATAAVPVTYVLGRRLFGSWAGAIASLLLASHSYLIHYAQQVRGYTLLVFLVALSSYFFLRAVDEGSRRAWVGYGVAMGLAIHTHFFAALVYLAHLLAVLLVGKMPSHWRGLLLSTAILAVFLVPIALWQPLSNDQIPWVLPLTAQRLFWFFGQMTGGSRPLLLLYAIFWILALVSVARKRTEHASPQERWHHLFVLAWIVVPVAVAAGFSLLVKPVFVDRFLIVVLAPLVLLAGAGIARVRPRWLCVLILLLFLGGSTRGLNRWYSAGGSDDWTGATTYVLSRTRTGDGAVFHVGGGKRCFDYYCSRWGGRACPTTLDLVRETTVGRTRKFQLDSQRLSSLPNTYDRIWLLLSHDSAFPFDRAGILNSLAHHFVLQSERDFKSITVQLYQKSALSDPSPPLLEGAR
jgi:mannosyltransferase